jgi:hypothetical protein
MVYNLLFYKDFYAVMQGVGAHFAAVQQFDTST